MSAVAPGCSLPPMRDLDPGVAQAHEQRLDGMPLDADLTAPCQHDVAGELGSVVADDHAGLPRWAISSANSRTTRRP